MKKFAIVVATLSAVIGTREAWSMARKGKAAMLRMMGTPLLACSALLVSGCATLVSGTSQTITVDVLNAKGAMCKGIDKRGRSYTWASTPSATTVHKGDGPIVLTCEKKRLQDNYTRI